MNTKYIVKLAGQRIGETLLESADAPMGVVFGRIVFDEPQSGYDLFKAHCHANGITINQDDPEHRFIDTQVISDLEVISEHGTVIHGQAGAAVTGSDDIWFEIQIFGIPYPFYEQQFPDHVKVYREQFNS